MDKRTIKRRRREFARQFYRGNGLRLALAIAEPIFITASNLVISWLIQQIVDLASGIDVGFTLGQLALIGLGCVALFLIGGGLSYISCPRFLSRAMEQYKNHVFGEISKKSISAFSGENSALYISALSNDANTIETEYLCGIFNFLSPMLMFVGALVMMLLYSPLLTLVSILLALLPVVASILSGDRLAQAEKAVSEKNESFMSTLKDALTGFSVVKSFRAEGAMGRLFAQRSGEVAEAKCRRRKISVVIQSLSQSAGILAQVGVFLTGAWLALSGRGVTPGVVMVFVQLMNYIIQPINTVPTFLANRKAAMALIDKLAAALSENVREEGRSLPAELSEGITLEDLSFSYEPEKPVLQDLNYTFRAGKSYAIVGASGSGKSTLLNLLMAGSSGYSGSIRYDGTELREVSTDSLYELVSLIQQNVFIFNASIRDNITMFSDFPKAEVDRAIELSGLRELIAERGEDYLCGENGSGLSGGEKQRLSIARSLLRSARVLLVDEATAALDRETGFYVTGSILDLQDLTRIVVTHSLDEGLLRRYDAILTLKDGRLVEEGTFADLMERKGYFYSLYTVSQ